MMIMLAVAWRNRLKTHNKFKILTFFITAYFQQRRVGGYSTLRWYDSFYWQKQWFLAIVATVADTALSSSNLSDVEGGEQPDGEVNLNRNATDDGNLSQQLQIFPFCDFVSLNVVKGCFVKEDMHWLHLFP